MANAYSPAWFETFGRPDEAATAREVGFLLHVLPPPLASVLDVPCGFGRHAKALTVRGYEVTGVEREPTAAAEARAGGVEVQRLYEPEELAALGAAAGLRLDAVCAGYSEVPPAGDTPRMQLVFRRDQAPRWENHDPASSSR